MRQHAHQHAILGGVMVSERGNGVVRGEEAARPMVEWQHEWDWQEWGGFRTVCYSALTPESSHRVMAVFPQLC